MRGSHPEAMQAQDLTSRIDEHLSLTEMESQVRHLGFPDSKVHVCFPSLSLYLFIHDSAMCSRHSQLGYCIGGLAAGIGNSPWWKSKALSFAYTNQARSREL
jgi:hypothetical protein